MAKQTETLDKEAVLKYLKAVWKANKLNIVQSKKQKNYYAAHVSSLRMQLIQTIIEQIETGRYEYAR